MESFCILGAGRFGSLAVKRILARKKVSRLVVVDRDVQVLEKLGQKPIEIVEQDAIDFLVHYPGLGSEWIVPAIPVHVAFAWLCRQLAREGGGSYSTYSSIHTRPKGPQFSANRDGDSLCQLCHLSLS